jgi:5-azacytidine-induced protein 1
MDSGTASQDDEREEEPENAGSENSLDNGINGVTSDGEDEKSCSSSRSNNSSNSSSSHSSSSNNSSSSGVHELHGTATHHSTNSDAHSDSEVEEHSAELSLDSRLIEAKCLKDWPQQTPFEEQTLNSINILASSQEMQNLSHEEDTSITGGIEDENMMKPEMINRPLDIENDVVITDLDGIIQDVKSGLEYEEAGIIGPEDNLFRNQRISLPVQLDDIQEVVEEEVDVETVKMIIKEVYTGEAYWNDQSLNDSVAIQKLEAETNPRSHPAPSCLPMEQYICSLDNWGCNSNSVSITEEMKTGEAQEIRTDLGKPEEIRTSKGPEETRKSSDKTEEIRESSGGTEEMNKSSGKIEETRKSSGMAEEISKSSDKTEKVMANSDKTEDISDSLAKAEETRKISSKAGEIRKSSGKTENTRKRSDKTEDIKESSGKAEEIRNIVEIGMTEKVKTLAEETRNHLNQLGTEASNLPCEWKEYNRLKYESDSALKPVEEIQKAIAKIENEEQQTHLPLENSMTDEELNNLRNKCMERWKKNTEQPLPFQSPVVKDFSNSAKLIRFLEETQEKDEKTIQSVKIVAHRINSNLPRLSDLLGRPVAELAEEVLCLKLQLEAEGRTVAVLRAGLEQSQQVMQETVDRLQKENKQRQESQRRQYGEAINRHQTFIDQLIEDKKAISQKCETLAAELRTLERRSKENISAMESRHSLEINRLKQMNESSDKLKRERWMDQKAKKIKEQTVRSLEVEVEKIMKKHTQEIAELRASAKQQMEEQEQALRHTYIKQFDQYRVQAEREKKEIIEQEKLFQMEKFRKQAEQIEAFHTCEVQQLREEIERERRKQEEERERWMREADQIRKIAKEKGEAEVEAVKDEMEDMKKALKRRHANELITLKANEESERKEFERKLMENFDKKWAEKEIELRANFSRERDMEIDRVIERLEFEMKKSREESERSHEERLSRLRLKHDRDITELVKELEEVKEKLAKAKEKQQKAEEENTLLHSVNHKLEVRINEMEETRLRLMEERKDLNNVLRKEFSKNLDSLSDENSKLAEEINTLMVKHKSELFLKDQAISKLRQDFEEEMQTLHEKVAETMRKKDKMLEEMRDQHDIAVKKIDQLEMIIGQQGKSMFGATVATKSKQK